ncbi:glutamine synthetase beta-grasp domain-containing protein, partial [Methanocaldococcus sp.]
MNIEQAIEYIKKNNVKFIRFQFVDILGFPKNVAYPVKSGEKGLEELREILETGIWFDGSSITGFVGIEESDMLLKPDLNTLSVLPWRPEEKSVARVICDVYRDEKTPFEGDPRSRLKALLQELKEKDNG